MGGSSKDGQVVGYKYFLGVDFKWCHAPIDAIRKIYVDNRIAWEGSRNSGTITINKPELFGEFEGGVSGTLSVNAGLPDQLQDPYLVSQLGSGVPAFRGVSSTVLNQMYLGNNPYLKGWTAEISRIHSRLMNGTAIVQWQDDYAAVPAFSANEDGYSSLEALYGAEVGAQQILIQVDLSSHTNGFKNSTFSLAGQGQDIIATKYSIISFLLFLQDQASWTDGSIDLGIAYFRGTTGTANTDNNGSPDVDPSTFTQATVYNAPNRGLLSKVGLTKADIPELIEYVQSFTVFPDTVPLASLAISQNATDFFALTTVGTVPRVNYTYSSFDFDETQTTTETTVSSLNTTLNAGSSATKIALIPTAYTYPDIGSAPYLTFGGYTSPSQFEAPTGWVEVTECELGIRSTNWGTVSGAGTDYAAIATGCAVPSGWSNSADPASALPASTAGYFGLVSLQVGGIYDGRYYTYKMWVRTTSTEPFTYVYQLPNGPSSTPIYNVIDSQTYTNNPNLTNILTGILYNQTLGAGRDMNPAHIIREALTDQQWGSGIPESEVDEASFLAAAIALYNERFGLSLAWNRQTEVEDFIKTILDHIDAVLYVRRSTGLWFLKLIRDDYDENLIPDFTDDDVVSWDQITRKSEAELVNSVTVKFNSRSLRGPASLTVNNLAQIQQLGQIVPATTNYPAVWQQGLASVIAERDLRSLSSALISGSISVTRKGATLEAGDVFKLTSARYGLGGEVMRVVEVNVGDGRQNDVYIKFVQDVFRIGSIPITGGAESEWDDILNDALPVINRVVEEENYRNFVRRNGEQLAGELASYEPDLGYIAAFGEPPTPDSLNARIYYNDGSGYTTGGLATLCPTAELSTDVTRVATDNTWVLTNVKGLSTVAINSLAYVGNEYVRINSIDLVTNTITVGRGCVDTSPDFHLAGTKVFFFEAGLSVTGTQFVASDVVNVKLLTNAALGQLPDYLAPVDTLTFNSRIRRPYPAGNLKAGGYYEDTVYTGSIALTWAHRDRTIQTGSVPEDHTATDIGPEAGTTYVVVGKEYDLEGAYVADRFSIPVSGNSYTLNTATYPMTSPLGYVRVSVYSIRDGLLSYTAPYIDCFTYVDPATLRGAMWYDTNQTTNMKQNSDGTGTVTADGDPVGFVDNLTQGF